MEIRDWPDPWSDVRNWHSYCIRAVMVRYWCALAVSIFFYVRMDILIWQRIFEANELWELGIGVYHWGWANALFGFMALGAILFHPNLRRMITFPLSLAVLAFSGLEDILYYWLDGRSLPAELPWLNSNPLLIRPVTAERLLASALLWLFIIVILDLVGTWLEKRGQSIFPLRYLSPSNDVSP